MTYFKHYGKNDYWEENYKNDPRNFEWIQDYKGIRDVITQYIPKTGSIILNAGCGMSKIPELLYNEGFQYIMNIDRSEQCISHMKSLYPKMPKTFQYIKMDALDMDFAGDVFTTVFDKGLLDAICSYNRSPQNSKKYIQEVYRVLKRSGIFICISHDNERQSRYLNNAGVEWESIEIIKIYRPTLKRESQIIQEEFVSKDVLDNIEDLLRVEATKEDIEDPENMNWVITPYSEMPKFTPKEKTPDYLHPEGGEPADIKCHYIYICKKPYVATPEPSEAEEEEEDGEENNYGYN